MQLSNFESTISEYCKRQYFQDQGNIDNDELNDLIRESESETLFLLDGWDDLNTIPEELRMLMKGQIFQRSTIIVTTRPDTLGIANNIDIGYVLNAFSESDMALFFSNYLSVHQSNLKIPFDNHLLRPVFKVPLMLWYYVLLNEYFQANNIQTRTELYELVFDGLIKRHQKKYKDDLQDSDILELEEKAYDCMKSYTQTFSVSEVFVAAKLGLVSTKMGADLIKRHEYTFNHKSIVEFLAAKFVVRQDNLSECLSEMFCHGKDVRTSSLFLQFVLGELQKNNKQKEKYEVFRLYVPRKNESASLYSLECITECKTFNDQDLDWHDYIPNEVTLNMNITTIYAILGLKLVFTMPSYTQERLYIECWNKEISGLRFSGLIEKAESCEIHIVGDGGLSIGKCDCSRVTNKLTITK